MKQESKPRTMASGGVLVLCVLARTRAVRLFGVRRGACVARGGRAIQTVWQTIWRVVCAVYTSTHETLRAR